MFMFCRMPAERASKPAFLLRSRALSDSPLVNDPGEPQGPLGPRGAGSQRGGGYPLPAGGGPYQPAPNHYAGRPNGRVVGGVGGGVGLDQPGELGRSPYLGGRPGLQQGAAYMHGAASIGRDLAGYAADTASYNGSAWNQSAKIRRATQLTQ